MVRRYVVILQRMRNFLLNIGLFVVTVLICLLVIEVSIRSSIIPIEAGTILDREYKSYALHRDNYQTYEIIGKFHPLLGWTLKENLDNACHGDCIHRAPVSSNSAGIRGKKEYNLEKPPNVTRIVTLGDSYTFGECVHDNETFSAHLEEMLDNSEVLNMGMFCYGIDQMLLRLKEDALKYDPDIILVGIFHNDINRAKYSFNCAPKPKFGLVDDELVLTNTPLNPDKIELMSIHYLKEIINVIFDKRINIENEKVVDKIIEDMIETSEKNNASIIFVTMPSYYDVQKGKTFPHPVVVRNLERYDVPLLDPAKRMKGFLEDKENKSYYFDCDKHYQKEMHNLVAEEIAEYLKQNLKMDDNVSHTP